MLEEAHDQVKKRLPAARNLFKDLINYSPAIILNQVSRPIFSKLLFLHLAEQNQTIIEDGAFIGSDTQLIAPITVGKNATIGAGSTITQDAPSDKLTLSRKKQKTVDHWKRKKKQ